MVRLSLQAAFPFLMLRAPERGTAISIHPPTGITEPVPKRKRGISILAMTEIGRAFFGREIAIAGLLVLEVENCKSCRIVRYNSESWLIRKGKEESQGMEIVEAIQQRRSIRAFKSDPVPQEILKEIMELALRAPSWANTQPWEFAIVTGKKLEEIRQAFVEKAEEEPNPDIPRPREFPEPYDIRRRVLGRKVLELKGISREDREKRRWWLLQGLRLFEAPCVIYIYIDRSFYQQGDGLNIWPIFDCGLVAENIMLLATRYGLGTIAQIQAVTYPDVLRKALGIPDSKLIVLGIAVGYPDWDDPVNQLHSEREPLNNVSTWYGF